MPKLILNSTGDEFFVPNSSSFFFDDLPGSKYIRYVPNAGHGLNPDALDSATNFTTAIEAGMTLPEFDWAVESNGELTRANTVDAPVQVTMWQATNPASRDFRITTFGAHWTSTPLTDLGGGEYVAQVTPPATGATAFFIELGKRNVPLN